VKQSLERGAPMFPESFPPALLCVRNWDARSRYWQVQSSSILQSFYKLFNLKLLW
jgi:hypothetical protein